MWTPPEDPQPEAILENAVHDACAGEYETALAKFLWFHKSALQYVPAMGAVRRSFALMYWLKLAAVYPPARDAFIQTRDETEEAFRKQPSNFDLFRDVAAMNKRLDDGLRTAELFAFVADRDHGQAERVYRFAEPELIAAGQFHACAPFLEPKGRLERAAERYQVSIQHEESIAKRGYPAPKFARSHYIGNVATLVALLALNNRVDDARAAYNDALAVIHDDEFRTILDTAMSGHLPLRRP